MAASRQHPLAGVDWSDIFRRLTAYAISLYGSDKVIAGTGKSPVDLAVDAIELLVQGKISYDGRLPLLPLLKKALYHDFLDLKKSASRRTTVILEARENEEGEAVGGLDSLPTDNEIQPDVLFREIVYKAIGNDQELLDYAFAILECGALMPADIASLLGVSTDEVENRRKRLRRRLAPVLGRTEA